MRIYFALLLAVSLLLSQIHGRSQLQPKVEVEFQLDGKRQRAPSSVDFVESNGTVQSESIVNGEFRVPGSLDSPVAVRLRFLDRTLLFSQVYPSKFQGKWVVGIDKPPFDPENISARFQQEKPKELWFISFEPTLGEGTRIVVSIPSGKGTTGK